MAPTSNDVASLIVPPTSTAVTITAPDPRAPPAILLTVAESEIQMVEAQAL
jgi:hypothetical protein